MADSNAPNRDNGSAAFPANAAAPALASIIDKEALIKMVKRLFEYAVSGARISSESSEEVLQPAADLDDDFESAMCSLWDLSADKEASQILLELSAVDILTKVLFLPSPPRLIEICVGIMANLFNIHPNVLITTENEAPFEAVMSQFFLLKDTAALGECCRFFTVVITTITTQRHYWIKRLSSTNGFCEHLNFILENSLDDMLVFHAANLVVNLIWENGPIRTRVLGQAGLVGGLVGAFAERTGWRDHVHPTGSKTLEALSRGLEIISTIPNQDLEAVLAHSVLCPTAGALFEMLRSAVLKHDSYNSTDDLLTSLCICLFNVCEGEHLGHLMVNDQRLFFTLIQLISSEEIISPDGLLAAWSIIELIVAATPEPFEEFVSRLEQKLDLFTKTTLKISEYLSLASISSTFDNLFRWNSSLWQNPNSIRILQDTLNQIKSSIKS